MRQREVGGHPLSMGKNDVIERKVYGDWGIGKQKKETVGQGKKRLVRKREPTT